VIAPSGGTLGGEADGGIPVQRTYLTARSTEFDAVIVAGSGAPADDAEQGLDAKAGDPGASLDPRVVLLLSEAFRHAKAIGAWGSGSAGVDAASIPDNAAGVVLGDSAEQVVPQIRELLAAHRAWERFPAATS
jgi:catalase